MVAVPAIIAGTGKGRLANHSSQEDGGVFNALFAMAQGGGGSQGQIQEFFSGKGNIVLPAASKPSAMLSQPFSAARQDSGKDGKEAADEALIVHKLSDVQASAVTPATAPSALSSAKGLNSALQDLLASQRPNNGMVNKTAMSAPLGGEGQGPAVLPGAPAQDADKLSAEVAAKLDANKAKDLDFKSALRDADKAWAAKAPGWQPDADSEIINLKTLQQLSGENMAAAAGTAQPGPTQAEPSKILSKEQGKVSLVNPLLAFFKELKNENHESGSLLLNEEHKEKLEEVLLNSGYTTAEIEALFEMTAQADGKIDLLALGQVVLQNPPSGGQAFALKQEDRPLFAQVMQDLGINASEVEKYLNSAPRQDNQYILRDISSLLAQARVSSAVEREGVADRSRLQDLLQKLGLDKQEIQALLNNAPKDGNAVNGKAMFVMLEAAAQKQDTKIGQMLKNMAERSQDTKVDAVEARSEERLRARMIQALQNIEAKVAKAAPAAEMRETQATLAKAGAEAGQTATRQPENAGQAVPSAEAVKDKAAQLMEAAPKAASEQAAAGAERVQQANSGQGAGEQPKEQAGQHNAPPHAATAAVKPQANQSKAGQANAGPAAAVEAAAVAKAGAASSGAGNMLPAYLVRQVAFNMAQMANRGLNTLRMELKPPSMGEISMELSVKDGALKASLVADTVAAKQALEAGMEHLKQQLMQQGLKVEQLNISVQPDAQRRHESANAGQRNHERRQRGGNGQSTDEEQGQAAAKVSGRLSVMA